MINIRLQVNVHTVYTFPFLWRLDKILFKRGSVTFSSIMYDMSIAIAWWSSLKDNNYTGSKNYKHNKKFLSANLRQKDCPRKVAKNHTKTSCWLKSKNEVIKKLKRKSSDINNQTRGKDSIQMVRSFSK